MARSSHPNKDIEKALKYAESKGWTVKLGGAHAWGKLYCPFNNNDCREGTYCKNSIWSTPRTPEVIVKRIKKAVDRCTLHPQE